MTTESQLFPPGYCCLSQPWKLSHILCFSEQLCWDLLADRESVSFSPGPAAPSPPMLGAADLPSGIRCSSHCVRGRRAQITTPGNNSNDQGVISAKWTLESRGGEALFLLLQSAEVNSTEVWSAGTAFCVRLSLPPPLYCTAVQTNYSFSKTTLV